MCAGLHFTQMHSNNDQLTNNKIIASRLQTNVTEANASPFCVFFSGLRTSSSISEQNSNCCQQNTKAKLTELQVCSLLKRLAYFNIHCRHSPKPASFLETSEGSFNEADAQPGGWISDAEHLFPRSGPGISAAPSKVSFTGIYYPQDYPGQIPDNHPCKG